MESNQIQLPFRSRGSLCLASQRCPIITGEMMISSLLLTLIKQQWRFLWYKPIGCLAFTIKTGIMGWFFPHSPSLLYRFVCGRLRLHSRVQNKIMSISSGCIWQPAQRFSNARARVNRSYHHRLMLPIISCNNRNYLPRKGLQNICLY